MPQIDSTVASDTLVADINGTLIPKRSPMSGVPFPLPVGLIGPGRLAVAGFPVIVPPSLAGSTASTTTAPAQAMTYPIVLSRMGTVLPFCSVTFAVGSTVGTFSAANPAVLLPASAPYPGVAGAALLIPGDDLYAPVPSTVEGETDATYSGLVLLLAARGL